MRRSSRTLVAACILAAGTLASITTTASAQVGTAITYQGLLERNGQKVNTATDMRFTLFDAATGGAAVGTQVTRNAESVSNGLFNVALDFGVNPYTADAARWMQIEVRNPSGSGNFSAMGARQKMTPSPFSLATRGITVDSFGRVFLNPTGPGSQNDLSFAVNAANPGMLSSFSVSNGGFATRLETLVDATTAGNPGGARIRMQSPNVGYGPLTLNDAMTIQAGPNGGNVGIGTSTPGYSLHIKGPGNPGAEEQMLMVESESGDSGPQLRLKHGGAGGNEWRLVSGGPSNNGTGVGNFGIVQEGDSTATLSLTPEGNVGIGTITPTQRLDVDGRLRLRDSVIQNGEANFSSGDIGLYGQNPGQWMRFVTTNAPIRFYTDFANGSNGGFPNPAQLSIESNGNVGIGTGNFAATQRLHVIGNILATGTITPSCAKLKKNVVPMSDALDKIASLNAVRFDWIADEAKTRGFTHDLGFIAEDVAKAFPEIVFRDKSGEIMGLDYSRMSAVAVGAIKQLKAEGDRKDAQITDLKVRLEKIEALLGQAVGNK